MLSFNFEITDKTAQRKIDRMAGEKGFLERKLMHRFGQAIVSNTQTNFLRGQVLNRITGNLANSMQYRLSSAHAFKVGPGMIYGARWEFGLEVYAPGKSADARPFVAPSITDYIGSPRSEREAAQTIEDWMERL